MRIRKEFKCISCLIILICFLFSNAVTIYALDESSALDAIPSDVVEKMDDTIKEYIIKTIPNGVSFVPSEVQIEVVSKKVGESVPVRMEDSGFIVKSYTFYSDEEKVFKSVLDCYSTKKWDVSEKDCLTVRVVGYSSDQMKGQLWVKDSVEETWELEENQIQGYQQIYGEQFKTKHSFIRIIVDSSLVRMEGEENPRYYVVYESTKNEIPKYIYIILTIIVIAVGIYWWKRKKGSTYKN